MNAPEARPAVGVRELVGRPGAWVPLACSVAALLVLAVHLAVAGTAREADEGTAAHVWQLLMAGQVPVILFFAVKWLPRAPRAALVMLAAQAGTAVGAVLPVLLLGL